MEMEYIQYILARYYTLTLFNIYCTSEPTSAAPLLPPCGRCVGRAGLVAHTQ